MISSAARNVLKYFAVPDAKRIMLQLLDALRADGYMVLGNMKEGDVSVADLSIIFRPVSDLPAFFYKKDRMKLTE